MTADSAPARSDAGGEVEALAEVLRGAGFWATHADRWNDADWQRLLWSTLAADVLASDWLARHVAKARAEAAEAPFRCDTHLCGSCGGCKAAKVRDVVSEAWAARDRARAELAELRADIAALLDWPVGRPTNGVDRMIPAADIRDLIARADSQDAR